MLAGVEFGAVIESSRHVTIRTGHQDLLARDVVVVEFDKVAARRAAVGGDLVWWQQLRSPHLIEIISAARNDAGLTLVLDQAACVVIGSVPLLAEPSQALFMCQALEALRVVHEAGHAHGGVGPEALLLDSQGRARLGLPGLSKTTSVYRAPELKRRQRTASGDIYSAGKVLERLAGHGPHRWADIIARATAGLPTDRFQSVLAMREAIEAAMAEDGHDWVAAAVGGLVAASASAVLSGAGTAAAPAAVGSATAAGSITVKGIAHGGVSGAVVAAVAAVAVVALSAAAVVATRDDSADSPSAVAPETTSPPVTNAASPVTAGVNSSPTSVSQPESTTSTSVPQPADTAQTSFGPTQLPAPITATPSSWLWTGPIGYRVAGSVVVGDIVVALITDANGASTAVGIHDGDEIWRHPLPTRADGQPVLYPPNILVKGDSVIISYDLDGAPDSGWGEDLGLTSLTASSGDEQWSQRIPFAAPVGLLTGPDSVVIVEAALVDDRQTAAIDSTDGHVLWDRTTTAISGAVEALRDDRVVLTNWRDNETNVVDLHSGQLLYHADGQASALSEPVLFTVTGDFECETTCALQANDAATGALLWQHDGFSGRLLTAAPNGSIIVADTDAQGAPRLVSIDADGNEQWSTSTCADAAALAVLDVGLLSYCSDALVLRSIETGDIIQQVPIDADSSHALAGNDTLYTVVQSRVTATSLSPGGVSLWSVDLPAGFTPSSSATDQFFYPVAGAAEAFDHRLLVSGQAAGGKPALAVVTDLSFTQPVLTQQDITSGADVAGSVGPFEMPDGTKTVVLTRGNPSDPFDGGTVELAVERKDGWHIEQVIELPAVIAPVEVGDLTGDGISEIVVTVPAPTGAKSWDTLYRLDPAGGPTLIDIPFATDELELGPDQALTSLVITSVTRDHVATKLFRCEPSCAEDSGLDVDWVLDRTGTWSLHPTQQVPPPAQTVCIRSNIDFSSLRSAPSLSADLLAKIPPGSCDVILVDPVPVQGNGFGWYHVQWNGIDGWTAVSNTA